MLEKELGLTSVVRSGQTLTVGSHAWMIVSAHSSYPRPAGAQVGDIVEVKVIAITPTGRATFLFAGMPNKAKSRLYKETANHQLTPLFASPEAAIERLRDRAAAEAKTINDNIAAILKTIENIRFASGGVTYHLKQLSF